MVPLALLRGDVAEQAGTALPDLSRYLLLCGGLILFVAAFGWLVRRTLAGSLRARARRRSLRVLDVLPLGGRQKLSVVHCYDRTFLLGLGDKEVRLIAELDGEGTGAPAEPEVAPVELTPLAGARKSFAQALATLRARPVPGAAPAARPASGPASRPTSRVARREPRVAPDPPAARGAEPDSDRGPVHGRLGDGEGLLG